MNSKIFLSLLLLVIIFNPAYGMGEENASEIMQKLYDAFYYQGNDMKANVNMELITKDGHKRIRRLTMLRKNIEKSGNQKYFIYFHEPGDVRKMTLLVNKFPQKDDDRWIFIPSVNLVKRIAAKDSRSSFVGSDFTYEDVSGRDIDDDNYTLLKEDRIEDKDLFVIQAVPKKKMEYAKQIIWIDKKSYLPLKEEYYDHQDKLVRIFSADKIEEKPFFTITKRTMKNMQTGHSTEVTYTGIKYNQDIGDELFSEQALRNPSQKWIE
jgi:outer membrane lipoprotein-sorting protein